MVEVKTYRAIYERDTGNQWFVDIPEIQGCHTYGRTLESARKNAFEVAALCLDVEPDTFDIEDDIRIPEEISEALEDARSRQQQALEAQRTASHTIREAVKQLHDKEGWNIRDTAKAIGLSYQRVHQLIHD